jgi:hypothetical protein
MRVSGARMRCARRREGAHASRDLLCAKYCRSGCATSPQCSSHVATAAHVVAVPAAAAGGAVTAARYTRLGRWPWGWRDILNIGVSISMGTVASWHFAS